MHRWLSNVEICPHDPNYRPLCAAQFQLVRYDVLLPSRTEAQPIFYESFINAVSRRSSAPKQYDCDTADHSCQALSCWLIRRYPPHSCRNINGVMNQSVTSPLATGIDQAMTTPLSVFGRKSPPRSPSANNAPLIELGGTRPFEAQLQRPVATTPIAPRVPSSGSGAVTESTVFDLTAALGVCLSLSTCVRDEHGLLIAYLLPPPTQTRTPTTGVSPQQSPSPYAPPAAVVSPFTLPPTGVPPATTGAAPPQVAVATPLQPNIGPRSIPSTQRPNIGPSVPPSQRQPKQPQQQAPLQQVPQPFSEPAPRGSRGQPSQIPSAQLPQLPRQPRQPSTPATATVATSPSALASPSLSDDSLAIGTDSMPMMPVARATPVSAPPAAAALQSTSIESAVQAALQVQLPAIRSNAGGRQPSTAPAPATPVMTTIPNTPNTPTQ